MRVTIVYWSSDSLWGDRPFVSGYRWKGAICAKQNVSSNPSEVWGELQRKALWKPSCSVALVPLWVSVHVSLCIMHNMWGGLGAMPAQGPDVVVWWLTLSQSPFHCLLSPRSLLGGMSGEVCVCTQCPCILAYILYNFCSSKLNSGVISQILCKVAYASSCLLIICVSLALFKEVKR